MSSSALKRIPDWIWLSLIPVFGAAAIAYAGYTTKTSRWLQIGGGATAVCLLAAIFGQTWLIYLAVPIQFALAMNIKNAYLIKTAPKGKILPSDRETAKLIAEIKGKVDINKCSKDELVYRLGLPIVYANNIESILNSGIMFLHIEDLNKLAEVPEQLCDTIEPMVMFNYYETGAVDANDWQRLNSLPMSELVELGLDRQSAEVICNERQLHGAYRSLVEVKRRTGVPISSYKHLL
jgi:uncharacterized protein with PQ loop repeat